MTISTMLSVLTTKFIQKSIYSQLLNFESSAITWGKMEWEKMLKGRVYAMFQNDVKK